MNQSYPIKGNIHAHSDFQIAHFVIEKNGVTQYGCLKQCIREIDSRRKTCKGIEWEIKRARNRLSEVKFLSQIFGVLWPWKRFSLQIELEELQSKILNLSEKKEETERELGCLHSRYESLRGEIGELDPIREKSLDESMWVEKLKLRAGIEAMVNGRISESTLESIIFLPQKHRKSILANLKSNVEEIKYRIENKKTIMK